MVLWKLRYSWRLFAGGILAYKKHTWCWGGYFRFTLSKARLFTCAAMQRMLSGVAVRGRIWHAAHALARDKSVLSSLWGKNQFDYYGEPRNFGHLFFQTLKRAHFLKSGRKKMVHIFVYQWEVQVHTCMHTYTFSQTVCPHSGVLTVRVEGRGFLGHVFSVNSRIKVPLWDVHFHCAGSHKLGSAVRVHLHCGIFIL